VEDVLLVCPGLVYRQDVIDRLHAGEPHQVDLWRIRRGATLTDHDLREMARLVVSAALPGYERRAIRAEHPYTTDRLQIEVKSSNRWVEIGECGLVLPTLLEENSLDPAHVSDLAMGLGLHGIRAPRDQGSTALSCWQRNGRYPVAACE
jgi:phenylalanyl-tRNA synthetase alpha chain